MSHEDATIEGARPLARRQALLAYVAERRREDPNWDYRTDRAYSGPHPTMLQLMSDKQFEDVVRMQEERLHPPDHWHPVVASGVRQEEPTPRPRLTVRAALPFGQRIRDLRRALGWTQYDVARELGVCARTIIRYEKGRSAPLQSAPLLALRRLESAHTLELDADGLTRVLGNVSMSRANNG